MKTTANNPLSDVNTVADLEAEVNKAKAVKCWCSVHQNGGTVKNDDGDEIEIDADQVNRFISESEEIITIHAPNRLRYLNDLAEHEKHAKKVYPDIFKRGTSMRDRFHTLLKACPELMRFPDYHLILGDCITGLESRISRN